MKYFTVYPIDQEEGTRSYKLVGKQDSGADVSPELPAGLIESFKVAEALVDGAPDPKMLELEAAKQQALAEAEEARTEATEAKQEAAASIDKLMETLSYWPPLVPGQWLQPHEVRCNPDDLTLYEYIGTEYYKVPATEDPSNSPLWKKAKPEAYELKPIYSEHIDGTIYNAGDRFMYKDTLYTCTQNGNKFPPSVMTAPWEPVQAK